jgi:hypothetical protein
VAGIPAPLALSGAEDVIDVIGETAQRRLETILAGDVSVQRLSGSTFWNQLLM